MLHFYTPLKTSENRRISDIFRGYKSGTLVENGLINLFQVNGPISYLPKTPEKPLDVHKGHQIKPLVKNGPSL